MKKNVFLKLLVVGLVFLPYITFAAGTCTDPTDMTTVKGIINWATCLLVGSVVPLLFALALVAFIWGVIQYYINPDNEEKRKKGKSFIIGGIIALFVMTSIWGIVGIFTNTFFGGDGATNSPSNIPTLK